MARRLSSIRPVLRLLDHLPLCLFSDIDGTLSEIVPRPEDARVTPRTRELLESLIDEGVRVCLVTGRPLNVARTMAGIERAAYAANHGLEIWIEGTSDTPSELAGYETMAGQVLKETSDLAFDGLIVENKGPVLAFHYRLAPDHEAARLAVLSALADAPTASRFALHEGRKVIELRPPLDTNKGTAVALLAGRSACSSILCIGDDVTDVDMFEAARTASGGSRSVLLVAVRGDETPAQLLALADYWVDGVSGVGWLLEQVLSAFRERRISNRGTETQASS